MEDNNNIMDLESMFIEETNDTPDIILDNDNLKIIITGPSFPENAYSVYSPVLDWIEKLGTTLQSTLVCEFFYSYINSASKKLVYEVILLLKRLLEANKQISITWFYEEHDDDMKELGEEFRELTSVPMDLKIKY